MASGYITLVLRSLVAYMKRLFGDPILFRTTNTELSMGNQVVANFEGLSLCLVDGYGKTGLHWKLKLL